MVITHSKVVNPARAQLNRKNEYSPVPVRTCLRIWSRETGSAVPFRVSLLILHTQAESGAYSRDSSRFPRRRPLIYFNRHSPLCQVRLYRAKHLRTNDVHCREFAGGTGSVVLKVVPVTGAAILQVTMDQLMSASLFPHPLLVWSGHVKSKRGLGKALSLRSHAVRKKRCYCYYVWSSHMAEYGFTG